MTGKIDAGRVCETLAIDDTPLPIVASVFTPYQLLFLERIWALIEPRPLMILDSRPQRFRSGRPPAIPADRLIDLDLTGKVNDRGQAALVRRGVQQVAAFTGDRPFAFLSASLQWPINNVLYTRYRRDPRCRCLLIDDGLSTYLDLRPSRRERTRNIAREIVARLKGFPARSFFAGHPLGLDAPRIDGILIGAAQAPHGRTGRTYIPLPHDAATGPALPRDKVMFVGQSYSSGYSSVTLDATIAAIHEDLRARGFARPVVKPHHFQGGDEIERYLRAGFELLESSITVEEIVARRDFGTIASINSTALLTCKSLYGDRLEALAYNPTAFQPSHEHRDMAEVEAIFHRAGVTIVDLPIG